jgi:uncharacterized HAD superfamily protein
MRKSIKEILENPRGHLIAIDLDGTLCEGEFWGDGDPLPIKRMVDKVWEWYRGGAHIIIYTARQARHYPVTHAWLIKNEIPFHGIAMIMKPGADVYIDDKAIRPDELFSE